MQKSIKLEFDEINCKVVLVDKGNHPNHLANATVTFKGPAHYFTLSGFTIWKSKFGDTKNVEVPKRPGFKYLLLEGGLKRILTEAILDQYAYADIPTIGA